MIKKEWMEVQSISKIAKQIYEIELQGDLVKEIKAPGQFVHVKVGNGFSPLLRRPISICDFDQEASTMKLLFRSEGKGTKLLSEVKKGSKIDVLGPLGNGFSLETLNEGDTALIVGGGIGVPPLYGLARRLVERGVNVVVVLGFATEEVVFYEDKFKELGDTIVTTVDGTYGEKGFVTDGIRKNDWHYDAIFACGPTQMLKALTSKYPDERGYLSLEERMGCGIGACFACVCRAEEGYRKVCSDGPVFPIGEVIL
ncbi:dihydroorotate dehydrogenase electron transfer subunit [Lottiidibacillus patelloidae]|uniref:Dihydroorotate dehydrogenase B (NAD(+)), electron transfer subunit n=1 Tax=Lottiidibacillus patelloidae TaxID=2670334 RepID=A0A263BXS5_9BACI|nr:dihydroorotate dehydrogenase electron transfer subunit [Lottiidibacillus patelloidae]OZM58529.1 dihydroorotate dehydrogenase electron transfer subunit [Lottiidibacillus patelloidae]